jgi:hypothetical protein
MDATRSQLMNLSFISIQLMAAGIGNISISHQGLVIFNFGFDPTVSFWKQNARPVKYRLQRLELSV